MNLATIAPSAPFLDEIATRWRDAHHAPGEGLILLPTRRAARAMADAFLRVSNGAPMLLPRLTAIGAIDEAPLTLAGALDLPPAVPQMQRLAELSRLILLLPRGAGGVATADQACRLAGELARLMDEAERAELPDLPDALARAATGELAQHWETTLRFLDIVTRQWPLWLQAQGLMNPAARQVALLHAQARAWQDHRPQTPIWVAGASGGIPAVAALLKVVAQLPRGLVILPGLEATPPDETEASHPQAGLLALLAGMGARPEEVVHWHPPGPRETFLARALLPAAGLSAWRNPFTPDITGLSRLETADQQEEAVAIALILRDALEQPQARAALVTPDRQLAGRVAAELQRYGLVADDSAGEPLAHTPPAVFLRLLAVTIAEDLAPVSLLALLKHPLAAAGLAPAACRHLARQLETRCLRGPKPEPGLPGLRRAVGEEPDLALFIDRIERAIVPLLRISTAATLVAPNALLAAAVESAEALATTDEMPGPARLWAQEEGEALATCLAEALAALERLQPQRTDVLPGLLDALLEGQAVRTRRALRGRDVAEEHPRVFIWGLLEARLQTVDLVVLGGLAETIWPQATDPGPWMSRPMRSAAGLPGTEEIVGQAAHDFVMASCGARQTVLSCPRRRDGAPAVPARWLARIEACLAGSQMSLPRHPAAHWARLLDQPQGGPRPVAPPRPRPAIALRPNRLSVTEIETWIADPYAIHAKHILRLRRLDDLEEATDAADYGRIVHAGFERFLQNHGARLPGQAQAALRDAMARALAEAGLRRALQAWWGPRLARIADWAIEQEIDRRLIHTPTTIGAELKGVWDLAIDGYSRQSFRLTGRADRIERRSDGGLVLMDYKTGLPPNDSAVQSGRAPQLPLEAAMVLAGAFGREWQGQAAELIYWYVTGNHERGKAVSLLDNNAGDIATIAAETEARLRARILAFDTPDTPYLARPNPGFVSRRTDYAQLARVDEWGLAPEGDA